MNETKNVTITLRLPPDIADQVEELHAAEPEFLERVVQTAIVRRWIYRGIREREALNADGSIRWTAERVVPIEESGPLMSAARFLGIKPINPEEGRRILAEDEKLAENRRHDGGAWAEKEGGR